tara:strand:- start:30 stop:1421 length:1392 start_codon:yes stop_codon:yes gene_type:complete
MDNFDLRKYLAEGRLLKEDVSSRFVKKYLSMGAPEVFEDIEDIESYSDRDKAILIFLDEEHGVTISDKLAKGIKGKAPADIIKYFQDEDYEYMSYGVMKRQLGVPVVRTMIWDEAGSNRHEDWYYHTKDKRNLNKVWRTKYPELDIPGFNKTFKNYDTRNRISRLLDDYYRGEARKQKGIDLEVPYEEYADMYVQALKDEGAIIPDRSTGLAEGKLNEDSSQGDMYGLGPAYQALDSGIQYYIDEFIKDINADIEEGADKASVTEYLNDLIKAIAALRDSVTFPPDLAEGKLLNENENYDAAWIASHSDYYDIYIGTKKSFYEDQEEEDASFGGEAEDYLIDLDPGKYQMIYWHDEGPENMSFNDKLEFVKESIYNFWGEDGFIEKFPGLEDELDPLYDEDNPDVYWNAFEEHMKDNLDKYYEIMKDMINNSYPDGDSSRGVVLLVDGKEVAGADDGRLTNFF